MTDKNRKSSAIPTDEDKESPKATESSGDGENNINQQTVELYSELLRDMKESVTIEEQETLEGQTIVIVRDSRGQLFLLLKNNEGGFEKLGRNRASDIPEEKVYDTFKWLKGKKIKDFIGLSNYLKRAAESQSEISE